MSRERDIAYGRHSQIPICCIAFFVDQWPNEFRKDSAYRNAAHESDYNYVPCSSCFYAKRKVKIVECLADCRRECRKDFQ